MRLPQKIVYACKAILFLSKLSDRQKPVKIEKIAEYYGIPKKYLIHILIRLKNAGFVQSARGISGGYFIDKDPTRITLGDIVKSVDEAILAETDTRLDEKDAIGMMLKFLSNEMTRDLKQKLDSITIDKILENLKGEKGLVYHI